MNSKNNGKNTFFERNSWYHRTKELLPDNTVKYGKKGGFKTEAEAEASYKRCMKEFEENAAQIITPNTKNLTFINYLNHWFKNMYSIRIENSTKMLGVYVLYDLILPKLENDIKLEYVNTEFLDELLEKVSKVCESAGNKSRELLNIAFKDAVSDGFLTLNPVKGTKPYKRKDGKVVIFKKNELKRFIELVYKKNWYLEILLGLFCGLRKGEILGLKFQDIDYTKQTIKISRQLAISSKVKCDNIKLKYVINEYTLETKSTKTVNSIRTIRVPEVIMEELKLRKKYIDKLKEENEDYIDQDFISCQENGKPHSLSSLNNYITKVCERNGLPRISVHSLRHMFATILLERGVSLVKISALLGHNSINTTFEFYCDIMEDDEKIKAFMNKNFTPEREKVNSEL